MDAPVLVATGVNADGRSEILGVRVATSETGGGWSSFFADLVARGLAGVCLVTSDAYQSLVETIAENLAGASWQRCRTHYAASLMAVCPKSMRPAVKAMLHSVHDQPDAEARTIRHVGAVLAEQTDEWAEEDRYLCLESLPKAALPSSTTLERRKYRHHPRAQRLTITPKDSATPLPRT